jgi:hypothetical protein
VAFARGSRQFQSQPGNAGRAVGGLRLQCGCVGYSDTCMFHFGRSIVMVEVAGVKVVGVVGVFRWCSSSLRQLGAMSPARGDH